MKYQPPFVPGATPGAPGIFNPNPDAAYINGDPSTGTPGSYFPNAAIEHPQREIVGAIVAAGLTPDHTSLTQLRQAIARHAAGGAWHGACSGGANDYTVVATGAFAVPSAPFAGMVVKTIPSATNTAASVADVFGFGDLPLVTFGGAALPASAIVAGRPTEWEYHATIASGSPGWIVRPWTIALDFTASLDRLPILPEALTSLWMLAVTTSTGQVVVDAGQTFRHRGHRIVATSDAAAGSRTFATTANKTYHLRWRWTGGAPVYVLVDTTDGTYNPGSLPEWHSNFDSTFDDMLIGRVVTNGSNVPTYTGNVIKSVLEFTLAITSSMTSAVLPWCYRWKSVEIDTVLTDNPNASELYFTSTIATVGVYTYRTVGWTAWTMTANRFNLMPDNISGEAGSSKINIAHRPATGHALGLLYGFDGGLSSSFHDYNLMNSERTFSTSEHQSGVTLNIAGGPTAQLCMRVRN